MKKGDKTNKISENETSGSIEPKKTTRRRKSPANATPLMASLEEATASAGDGTRTRRNAASYIERTNRFTNIDQGMIPFKYSAGGYGNTSNIDVKDTVILCQKAYYNFASFRNTIDLMTEFSVNNIYLKGGTKKSRDFFYAFFDKINLWDFQDKFFREYYRSGNVFIYTYFGKMNKGEIKKITQLYAKDNLDFPLKYSILNPADIQYGGNTGYMVGKYFKILNAHELQRLRNPQTEEDKKLFEALPKTAKIQIKQKANIVSLPLEEDKISTVFYKRQDYEPFAVPMGYPVMDDINWKAELKKMDMGIARTMQQAILLVTMGAEPEKGGINQQNLQAMQQLFENQSVGRVLIADYTTKAEFVIPRIADLLDPKKYEVVDRDILNGLNNVLFGSEKFANQSVKLNVFVARLNQARESFINQFLLPEMKKISKMLGFKGFPVPHFDNIDLKDDVLWNRIMAQLIQYGVLTPEEGIEAIDTGRLPDAESSKMSQEKFKNYRDDGLYEPITGGPNTQKELAQMSHEQQEEKINSNPVGRPAGTSAPQTTKKVTPIGERAAKEDKFVFNRVVENMTLAQKLSSKVESFLKRKHKVKELTEAQISIVESITELIIINEEPENWAKKVKAYIDKPEDKNLERVEQVTSIACEHQVNPYLAGILLASSK